MRWESDLPFFYGGRFRQSPAFTLQVFALKSTNGRFIQRILSVRFSMAVAVI